MCDNATSIKTLCANIFANKAFEVPRCTKSRSFKGQHEHEGGRRLENASEQSRWLASDNVTVHRGNGKPSFKWQHARSSRLHRHVPPTPARMMRSSRLHPQTRSGTRTAEPNILTIGPFSVYSTYHPTPQGLLRFQWVGWRWWSWLQTRGSPG